MSLGSLLSIARSALSVQQRAMEVTGQNVANANTPGYSRQTLGIQAATPLTLPLYSVGRGVEATTITRARDTFYDAAYRSDNAQLGSSTTLNSYLSQIEGVLNEPSTTGLSSSLDKFFQSFSDLANDPQNHSSRELVKAAATRVVSQLHSLNSQLGQVRQNAVDSMKDQVKTVNGLLSRIADLNKAIVASGGPGGPSPDLLDQRDLLVDQVSQYMEVNVANRSDGSCGITCGNVLVVDGGSASTLALSGSGSGFGVAVANGPMLGITSGSLYGLSDLTQNRLPAALSQLDQVAAALVNEVNAVHSTGYNLAGATGVNFFTAGTTSAGTISLSAEVTASSDNISASTNGLSGNGGIATQIAGLATTGVATLGGSTIREYYVALATGVGLDVSNTSQDMTASETLVAREDQARTSVSGVNVDEEMVSLITQQQAYQAAARIVNVANDMMTTLMQLLGG